MSSISIRPAGTDNIMERILVANAAFKEDKLELARIPATVTEEERQQYREWRVNRARKSMAANNVHHFEAVDDATGKVVGATSWNGPNANTPENSIDTRYGEVLPFMNQHIWDELAAKFGDAKKRIMGEERKDYWHLGSMFVLPEYQGRGIAGRLVDKGLELVDRDGLECYLEASAAPNAKKMYARHGFEEKGNFTMLDGTYVITSMVRPAKSQLQPNGS